MAIKQLRTLVAVADGGSFAAAAETLFMTQSAISMQMKGLEEQLRLTLFGIRTPQTRDGHARAAATQLAAE